MMQRAQALELKGWWGWYFLNCEGGPNALRMEGRAPVSISPTLPELSPLVIILQPWEVIKGLSHPAAFPSGVLMKGMPS